MESVTKLLSSDFRGIDTLSREASLSLSLTHSFSLSPSLSLSLLKISSKYLKYCITTVASLLRMHASAHALSSQMGATKNLPSNFLAPMADEH